MSKLILETKVFVDWQRAIELGIAPNKESLEKYMRECSIRIQNILGEVFGQGVRRNPYVTIESSVREEE